LLGERVHEWYLIAQEKIAIVVLYRFFWDGWMRVDELKNIVGERVCEEGWIDWVRISRLRRESFCFKLQK